MSKSYVASASIVRCMLSFMKNLVDIWFAFTVIKTYDL
jgi:hypothetical protein